jgi:hypothetical protein
MIKIKIISHSVGMENERKTNKLYLINYIFCKVTDFILFSITIQVNIRGRLFRTDKPYWQSCIIILQKID